MMNAEAVAAALGGAKKNGAGWMCRCPCHEDSTASLKVDDGQDGKLLVTCHAGCDRALLVRTLKDRGMWPAAPSKSFNIVHRYPYTDEAGELLYEVVRLDPKDFRQRRPGPGDTWEWGVKGIRQVPYRLPEVIAGIRAGRTIFVVEGEKDADALAALGLVATTNAGGAGKWRADWTGIFVGASVCVLPDNDAPGLEHGHAVATQLRTAAASVCLVELPGLKPKGDVSDWLAAGGDRSGLALLVAEARKFPYKPPPLAPAGGGPSSIPPRKAGPEGIVAADGSIRKAKPAAEPSPDVAPVSFKQIWAELRLDLKGSGWPRANLDNAVRILEGYPAVRDHFYYDEFHGAVRSTWGDGRRDWYTWTYDDTLRLTLLIQREVGLHDMADSSVERAVSVIARRRTENPVREWFDSLIWDGVDRLPTLLSDVWGSVGDDYHAAVGRCFMVSIAARVYQPGCQVDTMPIFEGNQGIGKSQALSILGGEWFTECHEQMTNKDFFQVIQGKLIVEISELHAFKRADVEKVKGIISNRVDRYRKSYGRDVVDHPRQCVFAGTTNRDDWHADETGGRRFLPVEVRAVNLDYLRECRDQLFAEAAARFKRGESWWDFPMEQQRVMIERRMVLDPWTESVKRWLAGRDRFIVEEAMEALEIARERWTRIEVLRIGAIAKYLGYTKRQTTAADGTRRRMWCLMLPGKTDF